MNIRIIVVAASFFLFSCTKSGSSSNNSNSPLSASAKWHVSLLTDGGKDETSDFDGYLFIFEDGGVFTAQRGALSTKGTWSNGSNFSIDLGPKSDTNKPLGELTDNWQIISIGDTEIKLKDDNVSGGEFLTFTKN